MAQDSSNDVEITPNAHNPLCLTLRDVDALESQVQTNAIAHMDAVWAAHVHRKQHGCLQSSRGLELVLTCPESPPDPAFEPFCGCGTCIVREILMSGYGTLRTLAQFSVLMAKPTGEAH